MGLIGNGTLMGGKRKKTVKNVLSHVLLGVTVAVIK